MQKKIFYWSPHINRNVATVKAVLNSIKSLNRYSEDYQTVLLNTFGEWNYFKNYNKDIKFL